MIIHMDGYQYIKQKNYHYLVNYFKKLDCIQLLVGLCIYVVQLMVVIGFHLVVDYGKKILYSFYSK